MRAAIFLLYTVYLPGAVMKLMYLLGKGLSTSEIKTYLGTDMLGEVTVG